jgi:pimeloyl-ACP methyl ester carboxylesterase
MLTTIVLSLAYAAGITSFKVETVYLPVPGSDGLQVALHCIAPVQPTDKSVLFIHGASFPTKLAAGFEFSPGDSWMQVMATRGFLACGLDFVGFGASSRPLAMLEAAELGSPVTRAREAAGQSGLAVDYMHKKRGMSTVHIVAHSWGTIPAATFAAEHSDQLQSLTLFGPIVAVAAPDIDNSDRGAWFSITAQARLEQLRFKDVVPAGMALLEPAIEQKWAAEFAASSLRLSGDAPTVIRIPMGPRVDIGAAMTGKFPYSPKDITVPVFIVFGSYDSVVNDAGASALLAKFSASPLKWLLRIDDGTHVMHLERNRRSLYESVDGFIRATQSSR